MVQTVCHCLNLFAQRIATKTASNDETDQHVLFTKQGRQHHDNFEILFSFRHFLCFDIAVDDIPEDNTIDRCSIE